MSRSKMINIPELFDRKTLKKIQNVFDFEEEKRRLRVYIQSGEWFTVAGLRRVGKTTLVRSLVNTLNMPSIYINLWELPQPKRKFSALVEETMRILVRTFGGRLKTISRRLKEISIFGIRIVFDAQEPTPSLSSLIEHVIRRKGKLVWIVDEVQELGREFADFIKYIAALHDKYAPDLVVILLGSVISLKNILEKIGGKPLLGRITKEIILKPFTERVAIKYLMKGFKECGLNIPPNIINMAIQHLGGFVGWLAEFGRTLIQEYNIKGTLPQPEDILNLVYSSAKKQIYLEISRLISGRRKVNNYIKILIHTAINIFITPSQIARVLNIERNTAMKYLKFLEERALLMHRNQKYMIADPLIRRALTEPDAEEQIIRCIRKGSI